MNGLWLRAAGARRQYAPAALAGRFWGGPSTSPLDGDWGDALRQSALRGTLCVLAIAQLFGCAVSTPTRPVPASRFYGTWANANPRLQNWLIISSGGAEPYNFAPDGACTRYQVEVRGPNELKASDGTVQLRRAEDLLLGVSGDLKTLMLFKRADAGAVCRKTDASIPAERTASTATRSVPASRFYGSWANTNTQVSNWMIISTAGVLPYGFAAAGTCETYHATTVAPNEFKAPETTVHMRRAEELLLMVSDDWQTVALLKRVDASAVCRNPDGTYAQGAPNIGR